MPDKYWGNKTYHRISSSFLVVFHKWAWASLSMKGEVQGSHMLEKYMNLEGILEKFLKIKSVLKSTGKSLKGLEKSLNLSIFCRT